MQATIMYRDIMGGICGIYRVVMSDGETFWYDADKTRYEKSAVRCSTRATVAMLLRAGYSIVGQVNNFKPKL